MEIDITTKLRNETKEIRMGDKVYPVNDKKNNVYRVMQLLSDNGATPEIIDKALVLLVGEEATAEFSELSFVDFLVPFIAVMALVTDTSYEETEANFHGSI